MSPKTIVAILGVLHLCGKKGSAAFQITVSGFPTEQAKAMEKTLAQDVAAKL